MSARTITHQIIAVEKLTWDYSTWRILLKWSLLSPDDLFFYYNTVILSVTGREKERESLRWLWEDQLNTKHCSLHHFIACCWNRTQGYTIISVHAWYKLSSVQFTRSKWVFVIRKGKLIFTGDFRLIYRPTKNQTQFANILKWFIISYSCWCLKLNTEERWMIYVDQCHVTWQTDTLI